MIAKRLPWVTLVLATMPACEVAPDAPNESDPSQQESAMAALPCPPGYDIGPWTVGLSCWDESTIVTETYCQKFTGDIITIDRKTILCEDPNGFCCYLESNVKGKKGSYLCGPVHCFGGGGNGGGGSGSGATGSGGGATGSSSATGTGAGGTSSSSGSG